MFGFFCNVMLALAWMSMSGSFNGASFLAGFLFGYLALAVMQPKVQALNGYTQRVPRLIGFVCFFVWEMLKANYRVAFDIITPTLYMRPGVVAMPLMSQTEAEIMLVTNLISLTPGTLSLDVSDDRSTLYVHAMFLQDEQTLLKEMKDLERRVLQLVR